MHYYYQGALSWLPGLHSKAIFTNLTLELIFDLVKFNEDNLKEFEHYYGGKLIMFLFVEAASTFAS